MKRVRIEVSYFCGSVERGGECIKTDFGTDPKYGDLVTVKDETWESMKRVFPQWFTLIADMPEPKADNPQMKFQRQRTTAAKDSIVDGKRYIIDSILDTIDKYGAIRTKDKTVNEDGSEDENAGKNK